MMLETTHLDEEYFDEMHNEYFDEMHILANIEPAGEYISCIEQCVEKLEELGAQLDEYDPPHTHACTATTSTVQPSPPISTAQLPKPSL